MLSRVVRSVLVPGLVAGLLFVPGAPRVAGGISATLAAQQDEAALEGRVLKAGSPVAGAEVTLHQVTPRASGAVAKQATGPAGRFRFPLPPADTGFAVFFVTVQHQSVRYFGVPVHRDQLAADYAVEVFDTASVLPGALRTSRRDIVLIPETDGGWQVNEILRVRNTARTTLVPAGEKPTWEFRIPQGATDFQLGEEEAESEQATLKGEWVFLHTPVLPGDREIFARYRIPKSVSLSELTLTERTDTLNLFVRQPSPVLEVGGLTTTNVIDVEGERFVQYGAVDLAPGASIRLAWSRPTAPPVSPIVAGVAAAVLLLLAGTWAAFRNGGGGGAAGRRPAGRSAAVPAEQSA